MNLSDWLPVHKWVCYGRQIWQAIIFYSCGFFILSSFFLAYFQRSQIGRLLYFHHTWCGLTANLECRSEMCCTRLADNTGVKNSPKNSPTAHHRTTLSGCIVATKALFCIDNRKNTFRQQYLLHMSSQYGELRPTNGWDRLAILGYPSNFQRVWRVGFVTAPTSLNGGQPNFARCLTVSWDGTLYSARLLPSDGSLSGAIFTLRPRYCTTLEQWASAKLCSVVQGIEIRNLCRGRHLYSAGRPSDKKALLIIFHKYFFQKVTTLSFIMWPQ